MTPTFLHIPMSFILVLGKCVRVTTRLVGAGMFGLCHSGCKRPGDGIGQCETLGKSSRCLLSCHKNSNGTPDLLRQKVQFFCCFLFQSKPKRKPKLPFLLLFLQEKKSRGKKPGRAPDFWGSSEINQSHGPPAFRVFFGSRPARPRRVPGARSFASCEDVWLGGGVEQGDLLTKNGAAGLPKGETAWV